MITENKLRSTNIYGNFKVFGYTGIGYTGTTGGIYIQNDLTVDGNIFWKGNLLSTGGGGTTGYTGQIGVTGATGQIGVTGATGQIGMTGATGQIGQIGQIGPTGLAGSVGSNGVTGPTGNIGYTGPQGTSAEIVNSKGSINIANTGYTGQGSNCIALSLNAGLINQSDNAISIGEGAGTSNQGIFSISIGTNAGGVNQQQGAIAIGQMSGNDTQSQESIAIGTGAGQTKQKPFAIAIGKYAGQGAQGGNCIAIGNLAGQDRQKENSIVLNATGVQINGDASNATFIAPIREGAGDNILSYNTTTNEVSQSSIISAISTTGVNLYNTEITSSSITPADALTSIPVVIANSTFPNLENIAESSSALNIVVPSGYNKDVVVTIPVSYTATLRRYLQQFKSNMIINSITLKMYQDGVLKNSYITTINKSIVWVTYSGANVSAAQFIRDVSGQFNMYNTKVTKSTFSFVIGMSVTLPVGNGDIVYPFSQTIITNASTASSSTSGSIDISQTPSGTGYIATNFILVPTTVPYPASTTGLVYCKSINLNGNNFRYTPWTSCGYSLSGSGFGGAISATTTAPTPATGATCKYLYSVIGNTMNLQFSYFGGANAGSAGTGFYYYNLPTGYSIDTNSIFIQNPAITTNQTTAQGTVIGNAYFVVWGNNATVSALVYAVNLTQFCVFVYQNETGSQNTWITSSNYPYSNTNLYQTITCSFPII